MVLWCRWWVSRVPSGAAGYSGTRETLLRLEVRRDIKRGERCRR